jgi:hypothetical protein
MKIINDTEIFEPGECLFAIGYDDPNSTQYASIVIVDKQYWDEEGCMSDLIGDHSFDDGAIPDGIFNSMEATWETEMSIDDARTAMLAAGFVESKELTEFVYRE